MASSPVLEQTETQRCVWDTPVFPGDAAGRWSSVPPLGWPGGLLGGGEGPGLRWGWRAGPRASTVSGSRLLLSLPRSHRMPPYSSLPLVPRQLSGLAAGTHSGPVAV